MNTKHLVKKFSYNGLVKEAKNQGWIIPTKADLEKLDLHYNAVWTNDMPENEGDVESHAMLYNSLNGKLMLANKMQIHNCVVLYQKDLCPHCWGKL